MKYIILVLVLLCSLYPLYGQTSNSDSTDIKLNNLLAKIESPGAVDSFIMTCVIEFDRKGNFDRSIECTFRSKYTTYFGESIPLNPAILFIQN